MTASRPRWTSSTIEDGSPTARLLEVGRVIKPHGLSGEVVVDLWSDQLDRLAPGSRLAAGGRRLEVTGSRPHQGRHLVRFAGVADRPAAETLRGAVLSGQARPDPGILWIHELVGATVVTAGGRDLGPVVAVEANPASDLLVLGDGTLIPLSFVTGHVPGAEIRVELPDGLLPAD